MAPTRSPRDEQDAALLAARVAVAKEVEVVVLRPAVDVAVADLRVAQRPDALLGRLGVGLGTRRVGVVGDGDGDCVGWAVAWGLEGCGGRRGVAVCHALAGGRGACLGCVAEGVGGGVYAYFGGFVVVGLAIHRAVQVVGGVEPGQGGDVVGHLEIAGLATRVVGYCRHRSCACGRAAARAAAALLSRAGGARLRGRSSEAARCG